MFNGSSGALNNNNWSSSDNEESSVTSKRENISKKIKEMKTDVDKLPNFPQEVEEGPYEHKRLLRNLKQEDMDLKSAQMKWRIFEGRGEAIYRLGIEDNGEASQIDENELCETIYYLNAMSSIINAKVNISKVWSCNEKYAALCSIKSLSNDIPTYALASIKVTGPYRAGKTTLISVLVDGDLDDGEGTARMSLLKHLHELESGETSSITKARLCFDEQGGVIHDRNVDTNFLMTPVIGQETVHSVVNLYDMPGPKKYSRTLHNGLSRINTSINMIIFNCNTEANMSLYNEYLFASYLLGNKPVIVLNKKESANQASIVSHLDMIAKFTAEYMQRTFPCVIQSESQVEEVSKLFADSKKAIPVFIVSCTSGENLEYLVKFLSMLTPTNSKNLNKHFNNSIQFFDINDTICGNVGVIVEGDVLSGSIKQGDHMALGPLNNGDFSEIEVVSIERNYESCQALNVSQNGTLKIKSCTSNDLSIHLRKGMILTNDISCVKSCLEFFAKIIPLKDSLQLKKSQHLFISIGNTQQNVSVLSLISLGKKNSEIFAVKLQFVWRPEVILPNQRFIFNDGAYKGVGIVTSLA